MGYEPIAPHTWDGETAISGTDVLEVATIYKVYVRALFRALFRWIYHNIALKYMALYGSSSIGPDIPSETYFGRSMWATLTWDTRLSHLEPIFKAMRTANTKRSLIFQVFLIIASFGGLCWVMLGLLIREKGQRWVQHWEIRSVRQMFVLEILIFSVFFDQRNRLFITLYLIMVIEWLEMNCFARVGRWLSHPQDHVHSCSSARCSWISSRFSKCFSSWSHICMFFSSNLTVFNIVP